MKIGEILNIMDKEQVGHILNEFVDNIFIIHLEKDTLRKEYCDRVLKEWGIEAEYWNATHWSELPEPFKNINIDGEWDGLNKKKRETFAPIVALNCSFSRMFREAKERGYNRILVLEDDFVFTDEFLRFPEFLENLPEGGFDLMRLQYRITRKNLGTRVNVANYINDYWARGSKLVTAGAMIYNNLQTTWDDLYGDERSKEGLKGIQTYTLHADIRIENFINFKFNEIIDIHPRALFSHQSNEDMERHITVFRTVPEKDILESYQLTEENSIISDERFYPYEGFRLYWKSKKWKYKIKSILEKGRSYKIVVYKHKTLKEIAGRFLDVVFDGEDFIYEDEIVDEEYIYLINQKGIEV